MSTEGPCGDSERVAICSPRRETSDENNPADTLILGFQPPELGEDEFLSFEPPSLSLFYGSPSRRIHDQFQLCMWVVYSFLLLISISQHGLSHSVYSPMEEYFSYSQFGAFTNKAAMNNHGEKIPQHSAYTHARTCTPLLHLPRTEDPLMCSWAAFSVCCGSSPREEIAGRERTLQACPSST